MPASAGFDVTDEQLRKLWGTLSAAEQQSLLSCSKKHLFEEIRCGDRKASVSFAPSVQLSAILIVVPCAAGDATAADVTGSLR